jgi:signal-transduction protein with cAMP-binding, CBS, and nucleotidyltransferase domain
VRLCILNHTSRREDVDAVLDHFETAAAEPARAVATQPVARDRDPRIAEGWLGAPRVNPSVVRSLPLFAELDDRDLDRVARIARDTRFPAGAAIVEQWDVGREFYVIVDGTARVFKDGKEIDEMGRGEFFGELAALEWGASFSYPRLATVLATSDVRALVLPGPFFNELVRDAPSVAARIRDAVRERMTRT